MIKYIKKTQDENLTLNTTNMTMVEWYYDDALAVHAYMKNHTGGLLTIGKVSMQKNSIKQNINTKSSTKSELVAVNDVLSHLL